MGFGPKLLEKLEALLQILIHEKISNILQASVKSALLKNDQFLMEFRDFWLQFCMVMQSVKDIFQYLERTILIKEIKMERSSFLQMALSQMRKELNEQVKNNLKKGVLRLIRQDRERDRSSMFSDENQRDLIAKLIHVILALGLYKEDFEP